MDVGEATIDAVVTERELGVVDAEQVQDRGVDVVHRGRVISVLGLVSPFIALAAGDATADATATKPIREAIGVVIASLAAL